MAARTNIKTAATATRNARAPRKIVDKVEDAGAAVAIMTGSRKALDHGFAPAMEIFHGAARRIASHVRDGMKIVAARKAGDGLLAVASAARRRPAAAVGLLATVAVVCGAAAAGRNYRR